ncbi:MAG: ThuA domain-containing protein [Pirellulales bacterium]
MTLLNRREAVQAGAALLAAAACFRHLPAAQNGAKKKILFYNKSATFEHSVVKQTGDAPCYATRMLNEFAAPAGFEFVSTKDGTVFDGDLSSYDAFLFFTTGDLTQVGLDKQPAISAAGKQKLLDAVAAGKGFLGSHCASDTFHSKGKAFANQTELDPYIAMLGGEFIRHGEQQKAKMKVVDSKFPGLDKAGDGFALNEEWYSLKNFASDMHVLLVQDTNGMKNVDYDRPPYPATWIRKHGKGRVFYTSMGHREDVWAHPSFQSLFVGALKWATGQAEADLTPNLKEVTPEASKLPHVD